MLWSSLYFLRKHFTIKGLTSSPQLRAHGYELSISHTHLTGISIPKTLSRRMDGWT